MSEWSGYIDPTGAEWTAYDEAHDDETVRLPLGELIDRPVDATWSSETADPVADLQAVAKRMREVNGYAPAQPLQVVTTRTVMARMPYLWEKVIVWRGWSNQVHRGRVELWWRRHVRRLRLRKALRR